ncbi:hypothetical protein BJY52DRAFT_1100209, partial [Lactarius psammicola]
NHLLITFIYGAVHLTFRFGTGFCGAASFSVAGGSISDMFPNAQFGTCVPRSGLKL